MKNLNLKLFQFFTILILLRALSFIYFSIYPFNHSLFGLVSPLNYHWFADINLYNQFIKLLSGDQLAISAFFKNYYYIYNFEFEKIVRFPGFLYPIIMLISNYQENNVIFLSFLVFISEILATALWISYLNKKIINNYLIIIFILFPTPWIFSILKSSDVFFYLLTTIIILSFVNHIKLSKKIIYLLLLLICMTRPAGASILVAYLFSSFILKFKYPEINKYFVGSLIVFSLIYYAPYFLSEINSLNFFNNSNNIFSFKSIVYLIPQSIIKTINTLGMQTSNSGSNLFYYYRVIEATILFIGFIYILYKNNLDIFYFFTVLNVFFVIVFLFPAYRYSAPLVPILFLYFVYFIKDINLSTSYYYAKLKKY